MLPYTLGDSLNMDRSAALADLDAALREWLEPALGAEFEGNGRTLPIGSQNDGNSCGVCVLNAIDHAIFGTALFRPGDRHLVRMNLFAMLAGHLRETVGAPPTPSASVVHSSSVSQWQDVVTPPHANWLAEHAKDTSVWGIDPRLTQGRGSAPPAVRSFRTAVVDAAPTVRIFKTAVADVAEDYRAVQGFQNISFDGEQTLVNRHWIKKREFGSPI
jgi:hypothetical protein